MMNLEKIRHSKSGRMIIDDIIMMVLLIINLSLIIFDWFFLSETVRRLLRDYVPSFYTFYHENIHENFVTIDLFFVGIFLGELMIRWGIAIYRHTYHRWFFYPFVHWYDTLGCIPISSFRFFRILRVISIGFRLQRLDIIDLRKTYLYQVSRKYYNIIMEEISDRVIINILDKVQGQIKEGNPVGARIVEQVILPKKDLLVEWLTYKVRKASAETYALYQEDIRQYLGTLVNEVMENNNEIKAINQVPVFGGFITSTLEKSIHDIVYNTLNTAIKDLAADKNHKMIHGITAHLFSGLSSGDHRELTQAARETMLESLELIKDQVRIQQWKRHEKERERAAQ